MAENTLISRSILVACAAHTGYRRAGMAFNSGENTIKPHTITETQLAQLEADPRLTIVKHHQESAPTSGHQAPETGLGAGELPPTLIDAIALLSPDNNEHFTAGGKPTTDALSDIVKSKVSATERDEAWERYQAAQSDNPQGTE